MPINLHRRQMIVIAPENCQEYSNVDRRLAGLGTRTRSSAPVGPPCSSPCISRQPSGTRGRYCVPPQAVHGDSSHSARPLDQPVPGRGSQATHACRLAPRKETTSEADRLRRPLTEHLGGHRHAPPGICEPDPALKSISAKATLLSEKRLAFAGRAATGSNGPPEETK